jgi:tRNA 2-thiocytidine biosynthesis protein TtcA
VAKEMKRLMGKALHSREMIRDGDHVMVAVSGGKDSLSLLWLLRERTQERPLSLSGSRPCMWTLVSGPAQGNEWRRFFAHGFDYRVIKAISGPLPTAPENRENPCFLCSRLRRKMLFNLAAEMGCNKIAFGHHKDDMIETFFLNVFYGASISTMAPVQEFFNGKLSIIRPLFMIDQGMITKVCRGDGLAGYPARMPDGRLIQA